MTSAKTIFQEFVKGITVDETHDEITSIGYLVFERFLGMSAIDIMRQVPVELSLDKRNALDKILHRINSYEPVQYILGKADFYGLTFDVDPSVLIPRPETEELVRLAIRALQSRTSTGQRVLDIGTGSGCIPIAVKRAHPNSEVFATDNSENALNVARQNAKNLRADITFLHHDILTNEIPLQRLDIIISNPPYISVKEKSTMSKNVLDYEPHGALFAPEDDALIFYRAIGSKAKTALLPNGLLFVEINERFGAEVRRLFESQGFLNAEIHKDLSDKDRIVSCYANPDR